MTATLYVVDAFTDQPFSGNPAAVCILPGPARESWMQPIANEMNLSETAFLWPVEGGYSLRWFTPRAEVRLCGHATLASAHALWELGPLPQSATAKFSTLSGWLSCSRNGGWIEMDFPADRLSDMPLPSSLVECLGISPLYVGRGTDDWLVVLNSETEVRDIAPNLHLLSAIPARGCIVTALSGDARYDFVSRFFAPSIGVSEDPVTGSAHCLTGPYWAAQLGKTNLLARQVSARGGTIRVGVCGDRVILGGQAVTVSRVELLIAPM